MFLANDLRDRCAAFSEITCFARSNWACLSASHLGGAAALLGLRLRLVGFQRRDLLSHALVSVFDSLDWRGRRIHRSTAAVPARAPSVRLRPGPTRPRKEARGPRTRCVLNHRCVFSSSMRRSRISRLIRVPCVTSSSRHPTDRAGDAPGPARPQLDFQRDAVDLKHRSRRRRNDLGAGCADRQRRRGFHVQQGFRARTDLGLGTVGGHEAAGRAQ